MQGKTTNFYSLDLELTGTAGLKKHTRGLFLKVLH